MNTDMKWSEAASILVEWQQQPSFLSPGTGPQTMPTPKARDTAVELLAALVAVGMRCCDSLGRDGRGGIEFAWASTNPPTNRDRLIVHINAEGQIDSGTVFDLIGNVAADGPPNKCEPIGTGVPTP